MENQDFDMANRAKVLLEEAQRYRRRQYELEKTLWQPAWFEIRPDPIIPGRLVHQYKVGEGRGEEGGSWAFCCEPPISHISAGRLLGEQGAEL